MKLIRYHFNTISSTNTWAKEHVHQLPVGSLTLITASHQVEGRGRFNRVWISPENVNIYATFCFYVQENRRDVGHIPQLLALAAAKVLENLSLKPTLKWPNDVLLSGKKVAGILCETTTQENQRCVICGIGLNVNMQEDQLCTIDRPATSLYVESQQIYVVESILEQLIERFQRDLTVFLYQGFFPFFEGFKQRSALKFGQKIKFHNNQSIIEGTFHCLNLDGSVTICLLDQSLKTYQAGEFIT